MITPIFDISSHLTTQSHKCPIPISISIVSIMAAVNPEIPPGEETPSETSSIESESFLELSIGPDTPENPYLTPTIETNYGLLAVTFSLAGVVIGCFVTSNSNYGTASLSDVSFRRIMTLLVWLLFSWTPLLPASEYSKGAKEVQVVRLRHKRMGLAYYVLRMFFNAYLFYQWVGVTAGLVIYLFVDFLAALCFYQRVNEAIFQRALLSN